jgi:hypothetical protein
MKLLMQRFIDPLNARCDKSLNQQVGYRLIRHDPSSMDPFPRYLTKLLNSNARLVPHS